MKLKTERKIKRLKRKGDLAGLLHLSRKMWGKHDRSTRAWRRNVLEILGEGEDRALTRIAYAEIAALGGSRCMSAPCDGGHLKRNRRRLLEAAAER